MDHIRERLEAERGRALRRLMSLADDHDAVVSASKDTNADDEHDPEGATIAFERSQIRALVLQAEQHLTEVDAAIERWESGTYGTCRTCGNPVGEARLEARPVATECISCASSGRH